MRSLKVAKGFLTLFLAFIMMPISTYALLPIRKHLTDATALNRQRAPLYAELTSNNSLPLSYELIAMENLALLVTLRLDLKAKKYLKAGVGLFHDDLVDMALTPAFSARFDNNQAPTQRITIQTKWLRKKWKNLVNQDDLQSIYNEAVNILDHGDLLETNQNCLTRHFVESIARSILNHEGHRAKAQGLGLEDPQPILISFLKIQINSLSWAQSLDRRAFPIQQKNVPFFCKDVPSIDY